MSHLRASEQMNSVGTLRVVGCIFRVGEWLCCTSSHKPLRSSCSFMWGQPLSRADLASQRAFSVPKPPSFICRSDSARPILCTRSHFIWKRKQIWTLSLHLPPRQSVSLPVSHSRFATRLSLPPFSFQFVSIVLVSPIPSVPQLASITPQTHTHTHIRHICLVSDVKLTDDCLV